MKGQFFMSKLNKFLSCAMMILCIVSFVSCGSFRNSGYCGGEGRNGDNLKWELDDDGTLTISGKGKMSDYGFGYPKWYNKRESVKKVIIEDGVTNIGQGSFYECSNMTEVVIPDSVTSIGFNAFLRCSSLKEVIIPDNITTIESNTFNGCKSLTEIVLPDSVTSVGIEAFMNCENLKKVTFSKNLTDFGSAAFVNTAFLKEQTRKNQPLIINNIVVEGADCTGEVVIPEGVTEIGKYAFYPSKTITSISLPESIHTIREHAFENCKYLEEINFPEGLKTIEEYVFAGCTKLNSIAILPKSLEEIHDIGYSVTKLVVQNPELDISFLRLERDDIIYCSRNSKAHEYAEENGYNFILFEEMNSLDEFIISNISEWE